jgi:hypothetical protein
MPRIVVARRPPCSAGPSAAHAKDARREIGSPYQAKIEALARLATKSMNGSKYSSRFIRAIRSTLGRNVHHRTSV